MKKDNGILFVVIFISFFALSRLNRILDHASAEYEFLFVLFGAGFIILLTKFILFYRQVRSMMNKEKKRSSDQS